jgi:hypothetical protein
MKMISILYFFVVSSCLCNFFTGTVAAPEEKLPPVLFLPGYGSSLLYGTVDSIENIPVSCRDGHIQPNQSFLIDVDGYTITSIDCVFDLLLLNFDTKSGYYFPPKGISVSTRFNASADGIESIYGPFFKTLETWGYQIGLNLFGVPYDYRLMSDKMYSSTGFITDLMQLIEKTYSLNGGRKVFLIGHSNGGPTMYTFLRSSQVSLEWKQTYMAGMIGLSGNFLGQMNSIRDYTYHTNPKQQNMTCSWEGSLGSVTWGGYEPVQIVPIVSTYVGTPAERNFSAKMDDLYSLFEESGRADWAAQLRAIYGLPPTGNSDSTWENTMDRSRHPQVDVYCLYGSSLKTSYSFRFGGSSTDAEPVETLYMDGDDNQDIFDNAFCNVWGKDSKAVQHKLEAKGFPGVRHMEMISNPKVLEEIRRIVTSYQ